MFSRTILASLFGVVFFVLAACDEAGLQSMQASVPSFASSANKTEAEKKLEADAKSLRQQSRDIVVQNTVQGALAGAAVGCLIAELTNNDCLQGAALGGVAGGIGGNAVGQQTAQKNQEIVSARQTLAKVKGIQTQLTGVERQLKSVVRSQNSEIASLRRQVAAGQISESKANSRIRAIESNRRSVASALQASESSMASERGKIEKLEAQSGQSYASSKNAVTRTQNRMAALRKSINLTATQ